MREDDLLLGFGQATHALELALELGRGPAPARGFARVRAGDAEELADNSGLVAIDREPAVRGHR